MDQVFRSGPVSSSQHFHSTSKPTPCLQQYHFLHLCAGLLHPAYYPEILSFKTSSSRSFSAPASKANNRNVSTHSPIYPFAYPSIQLPTKVCIHPSMCPFFHPHASMYLPFHSFFHPFVHHLSIHPTMLFLTMGLPHLDQEGTLVWL